MRDYGKVYTAFWTSQDARNLSEDGRTLALYLMTCPHGNMLGCFRLSNAYAADDLQWDTERVRKGFDELFNKGFAYRCESTFWVLIRQYLKWNQFENPNVGLAAGKMFKSLNAPGNVKAALAAALRESSPRFPKDVMEEFLENSEPFENPFVLNTKTRTKPEPHPKPEPATKTINTIVEHSPDDARKEDPVATIFAYWQKRMNSPTSALDVKRRSVIEKALKSYSEKEVCEAIRGCSMTPHNMGANDNKTKYNGLGLILRDADHIDRFINASRAKPNGHAVGIDQTEEERLADVERALARMNGHATQDGDDPYTIDMESNDAQQ